MEILHKKCKGKMLLELGSVISIRTKGFSVDSGGISPGMLEMNSKSTNASPEFFCPKCNQTVTMNSTEDLIVQCNMCRKYKGISEIAKSDLCGTICMECVSGINGEHEISPELLEMKSFYSIPKMISGELILTMFNKGIKL